MRYFIKVFVLSMMPISELRGAIPLGVSFGYTPLEATIIAVLGNILIIPILLLFIRPLFLYLKTFKGIKKFVEKYENRAAKKLNHYKSYRFIGLILLVGIPLPTTGVYTGVVASQVLNMSAKDSLLANVLGVLMSGVIMFLVTSGVLHFF